MGHGSTLQPPNSGAAGSSSKELSPRPSREGIAASELIFVIGWSSRSTPLSGVVGFTVAPVSRRWIYVLLSIFWLEVVKDRSMCAFRGKGKAGLVFEV